ncbi:MAG: class I SAM-dependent methyltransferase [Acidiferrobacteraceae bacterium]
MRSDRISQLIRENEIFNAYDEAIFGSSAPGQSFLDLSCGTRTDIKETIEGLGHKWVGIDQIDWPGVIKADVHHLPFDDSVFDVVYSEATFEHYYDPWQVAREVHRVMKPGGLFFGLIAFLQPWHGDSYYHFTHLGTRQMLSVAGFEVIDIRAGEHGLPYLIQQMFPSPFGSVGKALSWYGRFLATVRRMLFPILIKVLHRNDKKTKEKRMLFLKEDDLRFAASIIFLSRRRANP